MMRSGPKIGYSVETTSPQPMHVVEHNILVAGTTGEAGKTTAIEGLINRWPGKQFIIFRTKRGELEFPYAKKLVPFFRQPPREQLWLYIEAMFENVMHEKNRIIRATLMRVCRNKKTLDEVWAEVQIRISKAVGFERDMLTQLDEYFRIVIPKLKSYDFQYTLTGLELDGSHVSQGYGPQNICMMDVTKFSTDIQSMVIGSVAQEVLEYYKNTVLVIPEAWEHIPNGRNTTAKPFLESLVRKGRVLGNFIVIDSQDIVGIEPVIRKETAVYLLGKQSASIEAENTLKELPLSKGNKPGADEVQTLRLGQFFLVTDGKCWKIFAQPMWMPNEDAILCAKDHSWAYTLDSQRQNEKNHDEWDDTANKYIEKTKPEMHMIETPPPSIPEAKVFRTEFSEGNPISAISALQGEFIKVPPKPITTDGVIATSQARVTVIQRQVTKPNLDESTLEGRIGVLMADGFFDIGKGTRDIFQELERHYPGQQTGYDNFRKNVCWKGMQFWSARPYGYVEKKGEVWQITDLGKKYLVKVIETS